MNSSEGTVILKLVWKHPLELNCTANCGAFTTRKASNLAPAQRYVRILA